MNLKLIGLLGFCALAFGTYGQDVKTDTFTVYGNCGMCKSTIEKSLKKKDGIISKDWNQKTKIMIVSYDADKIQLEEIHQKIAGVGYDTKEARAEDNVYKNLHKCCQYERPTVGSSQ